MRWSPRRSGNFKSFVFKWRWFPLIEKKEFLRKIEDRKRIASELYYFKDKASEAMRFLSSVC